MIKLYFKAEIKTTINNYEHLIETLKELLHADKLQAIEATKYCDICGERIAKMVGQNYWSGVYSEEIDGEILCNKCLEEVNNER